MPNQRIILVGIIVVVIVFGGGFLLWVNSGRLEKEQVIPEELTIKRETYEKISAEDLGLRLIPRSDKRVVTMEITNLAGMQTIEYELSYLTKGDISRGVIGTIEVKPSDKKIARELLLGTCSRDVCKYDEGIESVALLLKITKTNGAIFQAEASIDL